MLYFFLALILGIIAGTITGLFPGIHINLIAVSLVSFSYFFLAFTSPLILTIFLVSMAITHTFIDYIPSVFLGAPDEDNFLSILPGHDMLIKGHAYSAVIYTLYGSISALIIILFISPIFIFLLPTIYPYIQKIIPIILILASIFLIYFEKTSKFWAIIIFLLSGFLGIASLNLPINESLLPLFTGLFGISSLTTSLLKKQEIPPQKILKLKQIKLKTKSILKSSFASIIASPLVSFLPGLGTSQAAIIGSEVTGDLDQKEFLFLLGAINTIVMGLSFIALYSINKARTGTAIAISKIIQLNLQDLFIIILTIILSGIIAFFLTIQLAKFFSTYIHKINYRLLAISIISILTILTIIFSGFLGLLVLIVSSSLGFTCISLGIKRTHLMGSLLLPVILFYI